MKLLELSQINFLAKNSPDVKRALVTIILMTGDDDDNSFPELKKFKSKHPKNN